MRDVRRTISVGVVAGLVLAAVVLAVIGPRSVAASRSGPAYSDCDGQLTELVIQYLPSSDAVVGPVYAEFLPQLSADVTVHVVCPSRAAFDELAARVGPIACKLSPVLVDHPMTSWSRDRWLALRPGADGEPITLLPPRGENGADRWPARAGDEQIAEDLAAALGPRVTWRRSSLYFDGGDFVIDDRWAIVTPEVALRNIQHTVASRQELIDELRRQLGRDVILLDQAPPHHAGMYMMLIGDGRVMVGDPSLAWEAQAHRVGAIALPGADKEAATRAPFDAVARQCAAAGLEVIRIPTLGNQDGRTYLAYLNAVLDERDGRRIVYMPTYRGAEPINEAAAAVWREAGYEVRPIDCTGTYRQGGSLRCLVNVLARR